jgi:hypothetical protein
MAWNYVLINHSQKDMKTIIFSSVWLYVMKILNESNWHESDNIEMVYEEDHRDYLYRLVKNVGYTYDSML